MGDSSDRLGGGGILGTLIGTLLTISHERGAEFRTRMLTAADEYLQLGMTIMSRASEFLELVAREPRGPDKDLDELIATLEAELRKLRILLMRIGLLFGGNSPAWETGMESQAGAAELIEAIREDREGVAGAAERTISASDRAAAGLAGFASSARSEVQQTATRRNLARTWGRLHR